MSRKTLFAASALVALALITLPVPAQAASWSPAGAWLTGPSDWVHVLWAKVSAWSSSAGGLDRSRVHAKEGAEPDPDDSPAAQAPATTGCEGICGLEGGEPDPFGG